MMTKCGPRRNVDFVTIDVRLRPEIKKASMTSYYLQGASEVGLVVAARREWKKSWSTWLDL
jgi:hypothetical protein